MDCCLSYNTHLRLQSLPPSVKTLTSSSSSSFLSSHQFCSLNRTFELSATHRRSISSGFQADRRALTVVASANSSSQCEFSGLNTPLEPTTQAGRFLSSVLQNDRDFFRFAVKKQLEQLAVDRDEAVARMNLSLGSDEACLHRRIAELKESENRTAVEEVMYMLTFHRFSEMRVNLVPRLSKCVYSGRLEIWPSKDWELESIHNFEVLELVREHLSTVIGWRANSNVTVNWATTQIQKLHLCRVYVASILYGYFLKAASLRHDLEQNLEQINSDLGISIGSHLPHLDLCSLESKDGVFGHINSIRSTSVGQISCFPGKKREKLIYYVMGFDPETLQMCAKPKSKEAVNLIEKHSYALFADGKINLMGTDEVICTSLASLKRLVLEAIAFGSFLWDAEECVNTIYKLEEY